MARFSTPKSSEYIEEFFLLSLLITELIGEDKRKLETGEREERGRESKQAKNTFKDIQFQTVSQPRKTERDRETERQREIN